MGNIMDYLKWRGDLPMDMDGFCEVDNLILCYFSYVMVDEVFIRAKKSVLTIREISNSFFSIYSKEELENDHSFIKNVPYVMEEMAKTKRFGDLFVRNYVNHIDKERNLQFSAMEILLPDGTSYVAFRGTDDRIIGWKEDFFLSSMQVEAQKEAVNYLNDLLFLSDRGLRIGGHSKGGHLAIYAGAFCKQEMKDRISVIYSNDGPGFTPDILEKEEYLSIEDRIVRYIPEDVIVGMLLEHTAKPIIVKSDAKNVMQHDPITWQIEGTHFIYGEDISKAAKVADQTIKEWMDTIEEEERIPFINDLFTVLEAPGVETLTDLYNGGVKHIQKMMKQWNQLSPDTKSKIGTLLGSYFSAWGDVLMDNEVFKKRKIKKKENVKIDNKEK